TDFKRFGWISGSITVLNIEDHQKQQDGLHQDEDEEADLGHQSHAAIPGLAAGDDLIFGQVGDNPTLKMGRGRAHHVAVQGPVFLPLQPGAEVENVAGTLPRIPPQVNCLEVGHVVEEAFGDEARILTSSLVFAQIGSDITIMIHMKPKLPKVGGDVTLFPEENKNDTISCAWYKRENETLAYSEILIYYVQNHTIYFSAAYDKRHFLGKDCLLHLQNLRSDDRAIYEIRKKRTGVTEKGEKLLEISRAKHTHNSIILPYRFLIWWCIWFNSY
ncbi:hypothetical protein L345_15164, partial [Ophiophagus hannah]